MKVKQLNVLCVGSRELGNRTRDRLEPMDCGTLLALPYVERAYPEVYQLAQKCGEPVDHVIIND